MKQRLFRDVLTIFLVWFVIAYCLSGFPVTFVPDVAEGVALIWLIGGCVGVSLAWCSRQWMVDRTKKNLAGAGDASPFAEATVMDGDGERTLYRVALPAPAPPVMGKTKDNPVHLLAWWNDFAAAHPGYAAVINDAYAVMQARPALPAGVDGHQNVTLVEHSIDVVEKMQSLAPDWKFAGIKNTAGMVIAPLAHPNAEGLHTFGAGSFMDNPIMPVAAFAHDLGKVACIVTEGGKATKILPAHGQKGAELLRTLPSVAELPMHDRDALLLAVKYYHHLSHMPLADWISDDARSLTALLHTADSQSSYNRARAGDAATDQTAVEVQESELAAESTPLPSTEDDLVPDATGESEATPAEAQARSYATENGATPFDVFTEVLSEPSRINGKSTAARVAWKYGKWVYVIVDQLAVRASYRLADPALVENSATRTAFMETLLAELAKKGVLYLGSPERPAQKAIWTTASSSNGDTAGSMKYLSIVVATDAAPHLAGNADCPYPPILVDEDAGELAKPPVLATPAVPTSPEAESEPDPFDFEGDFLGTLVESEQKYAKVAPTRKKQGETAAKNLTVTATLLRRFGQSAEPLYGRETRELNGKTYLLFDVDALRRDFSFDTAALPEGIKLKTSKTDGKPKLTVPA